MCPLRDRLADDRLNGGSVALFLTWAGPNPVREPSSGGTLGRMNVNVRRVLVTQGVVAACGVGLLVGFVGQPMAYDSWWNSDLLIWRALLVSALVLGATFGLVGGLAARAGHLGWAQAAVVAFAPLALAIPALLCGRWNVYDTTPLRSGAVVTSTLGWLIAIAVQTAISTAIGRRGHSVRHDRDSFEVSR